MSYNYGVLEKPTLESFKGLVKYAADINAFQDEIIRRKSQIHTPN